MLNTQRIVNLWARSKAREGEMQVLMLPYLGWALHSTSSRCFSASANSKEHRVSIWDRGSSAETEISNSLWIIDFLFPPDFLYHCWYAFGWLGFAHRLYPPSVSIGLLLSVFWPRKGLLQVSYGISIEHQTKDWCSSRISHTFPMWERLIWTLVWTLKLRLLDGRCWTHHKKWLKSMVNCMLNNTKFSLKYPLYYLL